MAAVCLLQYPFIFYIFDTLLLISFFLAVQHPGNSFTAHWRPHQCTHTPTYTHTLAHSHTYKARHAARRLVDSPAAAVAADRRFWPAFCDFCFFIFFFIYIFVFYFCFRIFVDFCCSAFARIFFIIFFALFVRIKNKLKNNQK